MHTQTKLSVWIAGLAAAGALNAGAGVPLNSLDGSGGVAFNPLAYPAGQNADPEDKSEVSKYLSKPQFGIWYVNLGDPHINWGSVGVAETVFKRLELSYGREIVSINNSAINDTWTKNTLGSKLLLVEENQGGYKFIPALAVGTKWKNTDADVGFNSSSVDGYVVASKLITQLPRPVLLSAGLLETKEIVTGVLGADDDYDLTYFGNVDVLPFDFLAVGLEYKSGAQYDDFKNANYWNAHVAWFVNKNLTLVAAYVNTGDSDNTSKAGFGDGVVLSAQYAF
ncbi:MAG: DUF3034 family protein [Lentisphaeria bacterium]